MRGIDIRVQTLVIAVQQRGMTPVELAREDGLTEQQVKDCLAFYVARPAEIDASLRGEERLTAADA